MAIVLVQVIGTDQVVEVSTDEVSDSVYKEALAIGFRHLVNQGAAKSHAKALENANKLKSGNIRLRYWKERGRA